MITPSFPITATERVLPKFAVDFTTASLDARIVVFRPDNTATVTNNLGVIQLVNANLPRFDFDPVTNVCRGLLIEEARTNLLLNSLIDGTNLATQSVTVTAAAHTLSFYGSGSVVLSGTHSATVNGSGAYPTRTTYTFTPTAGSLTLTISGTVQFANLELGSISTSFIPTAGTSVQRRADFVYMDGTNFSNVFNAAQGSLFAEYFKRTGTGNNARAVTFGPFAAGSFAGIGSLGAQRTGWFATGLAALGTATNEQINRQCIAYNNSGGFSGAINGSTTVSSTSSDFTGTSTAFYFGSQSTGVNYLNGYLRKIMYWPQRLTNAEVQAFSK